MPKKSNNIHHFSITHDPYKPFGFEYGMIYRQLSCQDVARLAHVNLKTAQRWANGTQQPHDAVLELLHLRATGRVLPDNKIWLCSYINDENRLVLPDGRDWIPPEIYTSDLNRSMLYASRRETERATAKLDAVIGSIHIPNY